jgi:predicted transcriptional regulator
MLLKKPHPVNRTQVCLDCGLAWTTAYDVLTRLIRKELVDRSYQPRDSRGREITLYEAKLSVRILYETF